MMPDYYLEFDGACESKPSIGVYKRNPGGVATYGWQILDSNRDRVAYGYGEAGRADDKATNNLAEFTGLLQALKAFKDLGLCGTIEVSGDSQVVIYQFVAHPKYKKKYTIRPPHLREIKSQILDLIEGMDVNFKWKRREENQDADDLSKYALQFCWKHKKSWAERYKLNGRTD